MIENRFFIAGEVIPKSRAQVNRRGVVHFYSFVADDINFFLNSYKHVPRGFYIVSGSLRHNGRYPVLFAEDFAVLKGSTSLNKVFLKGEIVKINFFEKRYTIVIKNSGFWRCVCDAVFSVKVGDEVIVKGSFKGNLKSYKILVEELQSVRKRYVLRVSDVKKIWGKR